MSSIKRAALLILAVSLVLYTAPVSAAGADGAEFLGDWQLRMFQFSGYRYESYPYEYGFEAVLTVREDGTAVLTETGKDYTSTFPGNWTSRRKNELTVAFEDRDTVNFRLNRGILKSYGGREVFTFTQHDTEGELSIGLPIDEYHFPDPKFRALLKDKFGYIQNCIPYLSQKEIKTMTELDCREADIDSLAGVRYLTELTVLICPDMKLESLDLSGLKKLKELDCRNNRLTSLNLSGCTSLVSISCAGNLLTELDFTGLAMLKETDCSENSLISVDLSACKNLVSLNCGNNALTSLDLSANKGLKELNCGNNALTTLDLSASKGLNKLNCENNQLSVLDLSANNSLKEISCSANRITSLNLEKNTALINIIAQGMESLTDIQLGQKGMLTTLRLRNTGITILDVSKCSRIQKLLLSSKLTSVPKPLVLSDKNATLETDGEETIIVNKTTTLEPQDGRTD